MKRISKKVWRAAAKYAFHNEGTLEIDDNARVSRPSKESGNGAYVAAWVWVDEAVLADYTGSVLYLLNEKAEEKVTK